MIFVVMGKSATGKDAIFKRLFNLPGISVKKIIPYTTRPQRAGEEEGREYHFVDENEMNRLINDGKVVEHRRYDTVNGIWHYFTVDDEDVRKPDSKYIMIATLEAYCKLKEYYGEENVVPLYIYIDGFNRLSRALKREHKQEVPNYDEVCRRYLADEEDFSDEKLKQAGIIDGFFNEDIDQCVNDIADAIKKY